jgi:hypothetical protein
MSDDSTVSPHETHLQDFDFTLVARPHRHTQFGKYKRLFSDLVVSSAQVRYHICASMVLDNKISDTAKARGAAQ